MSQTSTQHVWSDISFEMRSDCEKDFEVNTINSHDDNDDVIISGNKDNETQQEGMEGVDRRTTLPPLQRQGLDAPSCPSTHCDGYKQPLRHQCTTCSR